MDYIGSCFVKLSLFKLPFGATLPTFAWSSGQARYKGRLMAMNFTGTLAEMQVHGVFSRAEIIEAGEGVLASVVQVRLQLLVDELTKRA